jgi:hypothetical protein
MTRPIHGGYPSPLPAVLHERDLPTTPEWLEAMGIADFDPVEALTEKLTEVCEGLEEGEVNPLFSTRGRIYDFFSFLGKPIPMGDK